MKIKTNFEINPLDENMLENIKFLDSEILFTQDPTHIGTKLRNRLLKASVLLPLGNNQISVAHLKMPILNVPKNIHGLVQRDICPDDRQNFSSLLKIMKPRVTEALQKYIINSEATIVFIKICHFVTSSLMDTNVNPIDRIFRMWYSLFFLRTWKKWLVENGFNLDDHFISSNAFECIEINAHYLLSLVVRLRESNQASLFQTHLFDSQPCERNFRQMRSMTTMNYTKINFSISDLLHLIERVELQYDIIYNKLESKETVFPRIGLDTLKDIIPDTESPSESLAESNTEIKMPSNYEIVSTIKIARSKALNDISKFGINIKEADIVHCDVRTQAISHKEDASKGAILDTESNDMEYSDTDELGDENLNGNLVGNTDPSTDLETDQLSEHLPDNFSQSDKKLDKRYIMICDEDGQEKFVRKSSIVWILSDPIKKLSNDRLKRVQMVSAETASTITKRAKTNQHVHLDKNLAEAVYTELRVRQWAICWFQSKEDYWDINWEDISNERFENIVKNIVVGAVLGFKYTSGNTAKEKQCRLDAALITNDSSIKTLKRADILSTWYKMDEHGNLFPFKNNNYFMSSEQYIDTIETKFLVTDCGAKKISVDISHIKQKLQTRLQMPKPLSAE